MPLLHQRPLPQSVSWPQGPHTAPSQAPFGHVCCWLGQCPAPSQVASRVWMPFAHEAGRQTVLVPYCWHVPPTHWPLVPQVDGSSVGHRLPSSTTPLQSLSRPSQVSAGGGASPLQPPPVPSLRHCLSPARQTPTSSVPAGPE